MHRAPTVSALPLAPIRLVGALALIGLAALAGCRGGGPEDRLDSPEAIQHGRELFAANCAECHGARGDGQGPRAAVLVKAPTDFTDPVWRAGAQPQAVFAAIRLGVQGSAMPAWPAFTEEETWNLVAYVLSLADRGADGGGGA
jgi:mono/diheme cytochrome c family protein